MAVKKWTPDEERFLRQNYERMTNKDLAEKLKVSPKTIASKLASLGLERTKKAKGQKSSKKPAISAGPVQIHKNVQCRHCLMVDGYTEQEDTCRYCGAKLFKGETL